MRHLEDFPALLLEKQNPKDTEKKKCGTCRIFTLYVHTMINKPLCIFSSQFAASVSINYTDKSWFHKRKREFN